MKNLNVTSPTLLDRAIVAVAPVYGARRFAARTLLYASGQFAGAKSKKAALKAWRTFSGSADADSIGDLPTLRARSRDLGRNNPIATGARATARTHTVGTGLRVRAQIDRELLNLAPEVAEAWERNTEKRFNLWALSRGADITLCQNFYELQGLVFDAVFESGDCVVLRRKAKLRSAVSPLALAIVEADRIVTPYVEGSNPDVRAGVRLDEDGAPVSYFVLDQHPGDMAVPLDLGFEEVLAYGERSGELMALHVFRRLRPGQTRGIPELAPIIEILKQLDRYTEAELMAAVVASFFTVFLETNDGSGFAPGASDVPGLNLDPEEVALGPGAVVNLQSGEKVQTANPGRSNSNFEAFFSSMVRQIGVALSIPYELLIMHFTASYTASRAAIEMAAKFFAERREWLVRSFCQPVYEWFLLEEILAGRISAPGFFADPTVRAAWCGTMWVPPAGLVLDPKKEWEGYAAGVALGPLTLEEVALRTSGSDWKQRTEQRGREHAARVAFGLEPAVLDDGNAPALDPKIVDGGDAENDADAPPAKTKGGK